MAINYNYCFEKLKWHFVLFTVKILHFYESEQMESTTDPMYADLQYPKIQKIQIQ